MDSFIVGLKPARAYFLGAHAELDIWPDSFTLQWRNLVVKVMPNQGQAMTLQSACCHHIPTILDVAADKLACPHCLKATPHGRSMKKYSMNTEAMEAALYALYEDLYDPLSATIYLREFMDFHAVFLQTIPRASSELFSFSWHEAQVKLKAYPDHPIVLVKDTTHE